MNKYTIILSLLPFCAFAGDERVAAITDGVAHTTLGPAVVEAHLAPKNDPAYGHLAGQPIDPRHVERLKAFADRVHPTHRTATNTESGTH